ncbi:hypothetical protein [Roseibium algae]|uniref:Uncharacterized protein n=1 Tax=Roseibium algae TaxID=3123038 RepID=A0ABU8TEQ0_9HYPH
MTKFPSTQPTSSEPSQSEDLQRFVPAGLLTLALIATVIGIAHGIELTLPALFTALAAMLITTTYLAARLIQGLTAVESDMMTTAIPVQRTMTKS